jgi:predicted lipid-binding transport protein (Tim44 family)
MVGSLLIGMLVGLVICIGLIISGTNFWWALAAYSVSGMVATLAAAVFSGYVRDAQNEGPSSRSDERHVPDQCHTSSARAGARMYAPSRYVPTAQASRPNVSSYEP